MPENTVKVDRSTKYGNPFTPTMLHVPKRSKTWVELGQLGAVQAFRTLMETNLRIEPSKTAELLEPLRGKNLACWCKAEEPCHADVLLELANAKRPA